MSNQTRPQNRAQTRTASRHAITLRDVAERAGVSISAVSRAFTPGASVSPTTRVKVEAAADELGYAPSMIARSLMTGKTKLVGLLADNFANPAYLDVFDHFTARLQDHGYRPILVNLSAGMDSLSALALLRQYGVDGVIIATSTLPADFDIRLHDAGIPVVHCLGKAGTGLPVHVAGIDNVAGGAMAADALADCGHREVAVLAGPKNATSTIDRLAGFTARAARRGLSIATLIHASAYSHDAGRAGMKTLLETGRFDSVFCGDDVIALGAIDLARTHGLSVPHDFGVIGFNDIAMAAWDSYRLTTIRQPFRQIVGASVDLIVEAMDAPDSPPRTWLTGCEVIWRDTLPRPVETVQKPIEAR